MPGVSTPDDERMPASSADGRYFAWVHHRPGDDGDELFVYDFDTQQLVNATPTNLGSNPSTSAAGVFRRLEGNLSIADDPTVTRQVILVGTATLTCRYVPVGSSTPPPKGGGTVIVNHVSYQQVCNLTFSVKVDREGRVPRPADRR